MPIRDGDILAVKFCQKLFGQDVCMVWTITTQAPSGAIDLTWLAQRLRDVFTPILGALQSQAVVNNNIRIDNLTDGIDFTEVPWSGAGWVGGEPMPPFVAYGVKLLRGNKTTRTGSKRIPGVVEAANNWGEVADTFQSVHQAAAAAFGSVHALSDTNGSVNVVPVIVGRKPGGFDLTRVQPVVGYQAVRRLTTQNTRKI